MVALKTSRTNCAHLKLCTIKVKIDFSSSRQLINLQRRAWDKLSITMNTCLFWLWVLSDAVVNRDCLGNFHWYVQGYRVSGLVFTSYSMSDDQTHLYKKNCKQTWMLWKGLCEVVRFWCESLLLLNLKRYPLIYSIQIKRRDLALLSRRNMHKWMSNFSQISWLIISTG